MTFEEYVATERARYERLAEIVESILVAALDARRELRLQHTQNRAKEADSLERKLKRAGQFDAKDVELHVKDLAGCRLIFYTNSDVAAFLSSRIIADNFEIDWDRTKIHHPQAGSDSAAEQFISNNYVVRLKDDRASLPEYSAVSSLWCEVQVQTTLNHAWAEMAHDTIYKKPDLPGGFGASLMESIEKRMASIMREHLLPVGYEFQKVLNDFERLSTGKELFDRGLLNAVAECQDNNDRFDVLQRFSGYVLPHYDDVAGVYDEIRSAMREAALGARATPQKSIETPFGALPGHTHAEVSNKIADVIDRLRYVDVQSTFEFVLEMFVGASDADERARWIKSGEDLAHHEIPAWEKVGPAIQLALLARIKSLPGKLKQSARQLLVAVLQKFLETEITTTDADFDKVIFRSGTIPFNNAVGKMRRDAIRLLKLFFLTAETDGDRKAAMSALHEGTRYPRGKLAEELQVEILDNSVDIVDFYRTTASRMGYELLESVEHNVLWLFRHTPPHADGTEPTKVEAARVRLRNAIMSFRESVNADEQFVIYKTLVGYESVFEPSWDNDNFDISEIDNYRSQRIDEYIASISDNNANLWLDVIRLCAATQSGDLATFPKFSEFLEKLASAKPELAFCFLQEEEELLINFLPSLVRGLEGTPVYDQLRSLMAKWVENGAHLSPIVWAFRSSAKVDLDLLQSAARQAVAKQDAIALLNCITVADLRNADVEGGLINSLLLPSIRALKELGEHGWTRAVWGMRANSAFNSLNDGQANEVLRALVLIPRLDWREEDILTAIAKSRPKLVIEFFGQRLSAKAQQTGGFNPIPFQFYRLQHELIKEPDLVIDAARGWFEEDPALFVYRGGKLVANVFEGTWPVLEAEFRKFVSAGQQRDLDFVLQVLRTFEGEAFLHPLVKDIIEQLEPQSDMLAQVDLVLNESGVVSGEFGFVELYKQRRTQIQAWLADPRPRVRDFAERHIRGLERMIAAEQRRAEEDYEMRKRNWGVPDDN